jgi:pre-rRNA-processing protein IPI1
MVRPKSSAKKQQKHGIDFKKIKHKIGKKLPPAKNTTNTEIKSKAIILPEQSVASDKTGLAVSKKGLTLKELLHQTSHHNTKVRKDALIGIRDIFVKYPSELKLHKLAAVEKLRERISDDDKLVRESLYQLFKAIIFPSCKEENQGPFISLVMSYIFNAMTHLAIDVRLMAFKFFDLVVEYYPSSFSSYAEKILQNYEDILQKNQFLLQEKGKLKSTLAGLTRCLTLLPYNKLEEDSSSHNDVATERVLHAYEAELPEDSAGLFVIKKKLKDLLPILVGCFHEFIPLVNAATQLDSQSFDCMLSILTSIDLVVKFFVNGVSKSNKDLQVGGWNQTFSSVFLKKIFNLFPVNPTWHLSDKEDNRYFILNIMITEIFLCKSDWTFTPADILERFLEFIEIALRDKIGNSAKSSKAFYEKHSLSLIPFIPKLIAQLEKNWKIRLLLAFTKVFKNCKSESSLKLVCLSAIDEMVIPNHGCAHLASSDDKILEHQISWIKELPSLLISLGDKHPSSSKAVVRLQLRLGQCALLNVSFSQEYDNMQLLLAQFYAKSSEDSKVSFGPFIRHSREIQELCLCCLYYFSSLDSVLLRSLASCLCHDLDPNLSFRILEVLHSAYKAGHIQLSDYISFLVTLLVRFKVYPEKKYPIIFNDGKSNIETFKLITSKVCSSLTQIGDVSFVFKMIERIVIDQIQNMVKVDLENTCALLRMIITVDCIPSRLSDHSISMLSITLAQYMVAIVSCIRESDDDVSTTTFIRKSRRRYYLLPCLFLLYSSTNIQMLVLQYFESFITKDIPGESTNYAVDVSSRVCAVVSVLNVLLTDEKLRRMLLLQTVEIDSILYSVRVIQESKKYDLTIEDKHNLNRAFEQLKRVVGK